MRGASPLSLFLRLGFCSSLACHTMQNIQWVIMLMWDLIHVKLCIMDWCGTKSSIRRISALKRVTQHNILFFCCFWFTERHWMTTLGPHVNTPPLTQCAGLPSLAGCVGLCLCIWVSICLCQSWPCFVSDLQSSCSSVEVRVHDWHVVIFQQWVRLWDRHHRRPHITPPGAVCTRVAEPWPQACGVNWFTRWQ